MDRYSKYACIIYSNYLYLFKNQKRIYNFYKIKFSTFKKSNLYIRYINMNDQNETNTGVCQQMSVENYMGNELSST